MALLRNFATVGAATAASRVLGFVRDMLMAAALGTGPVADAFFVAFRFPNLFRRLFAEGAFNSAFIPLFARRLEGDGPDAAKSFAEEALAALLLMLLGLTAVAEIAMVPLMYVLAPGFSADPEKFDLAVALTRICFPYLTFVSLLALISGALNAFGRFAVAAFAPVLLNVVLIATLTLIVLTGRANSEIAGYWLSIGVFIGGVVQLAAVIYELRRAEFTLKLRKPAFTPGVRRLLTLSVPAVIAGGITQINIVIGTMIASLAAGAVSYLYYADRIYQLPLGIVGIAIGVVLLPDLARRLRAGEESSAIVQMNRALEFAMILTLPAAVALAIVAGPIVEGLFQRGAFGPEDTRATAAALAAFAFGLPGFVLIKVFSPGFFAREDTKTPMWFALANTTINIALSLMLFPELGHVGIAIATSIGGTVNALLLGMTLYRQDRFRPDARLVTRMIGVFIASVVMGIALFAATIALRVTLGVPETSLMRLIILAILVIVGLAVFAVAATVGGVTSRAELMAAIRRR